MCISQHHADWYNAQKFSQIFWRPFAGRKLPHGTELNFFVILQIVINCATQIYQTQT